VVEVVCELAALEARVVVLGEALHLQQAVKGANPKQILYLLTRKPKLLFQ
jgi:hypothetical protein